MEVSLVLVINDEIHIDIDNFSETLINANSMNSYPEAFAHISNFNTNFSFLQNIVINKLSVLKNELEIWHSDEYTHVSRLELNIDENTAQYTLAFVK